jgi:DNA mismatch repair protein MutS2
VNEMLDRTRQKLRRVLEQAQDEVRTSVRKLDELRNRKDVDGARSGLNETFTRSARQIEAALGEEAPELADTLETVLSPAADVPEPEAVKIETGMTVRVPRWKTTGTVLAVSGNKVKVSMGTLQMQMSLGDIEALAPQEAQQVAIQKQRQAARVTDVDRPPAPAARIDLRGVRFEEAMSQLESYLDQAFRSGALREVTIVHGLGTGAIREGARKLLGELPYIKEFRDGGVGMGGSGATIVEFE